MTYNYTYGPKTEFNRLVNIKNMKDHYLSNPLYKLDLPNNIDKDKFFRLNESQISEIVRQEYSPIPYETGKETIISISQNYLKDFFCNFSKLFRGAQTEYNVGLTKYGTGGSYHFPNTIIINIESRKGEDAVRTLFHETIHLAIEKDIKKYGVSHYEKERIVDLIASKISPVFTKFQNIQNREYIDEIFNLYYPDIEKIIEETANKIKGLGEQK